MKSNKFFRSHFSSKRSALTLGVVLGVASLFTSITFAQHQAGGTKGGLDPNPQTSTSNLTIATNGLVNNAITIKNIFLSAAGLARSGDDVTISLVGASGAVKAATVEADQVSTDFLNVSSDATVDGNLTVQREASVGGNLEVGSLTSNGDVFIYSDAVNCRPERQGHGIPQEKRCLLIIDQDGKIWITDDLSERMTDDSQVFQRNPNNDQDGFFATPDGTAAIAGKNTDAGQQYLRVGVTQENLQGPDMLDTAMVVAGSSEIRGNLLLRKANGTTYGNETANRNLKITNNYTELNTTIHNDLVEVFAQQKVGLNPSTKANYSINAKGVGINTSAPTQALDVVGHANISQTLKVGSNLTVNNSFTLKGNGITTVEGGMEDGELAGRGIGGEEDDGGGMQGVVQAPGDGGGDAQPVFVEANGTTNTFTIKKNSSSSSNVLNVVGNTSLNGNTTVGGTLKTSTYAAIGYESTWSPSSTDKLFVNGTARANAYYYNSDARYKANIALLKTPLEKLLSVHGYSYYNKLSEKNDIGVIAQEVEKAYPELVQTDDEGYKSVSYGNLVAPVIEAIRELSNKLDSLFDKYADQQAQLKSQQSQINALEARLQALEQAK